MWLNKTTKFFYTATHWHAIFTSPHYGEFTTRKKPNICIYNFSGKYPYEWPIVALNIFGRGSSIGALCICYIYSAEIFPTVIRNVGIGSSSVWVMLESELHAQLIPVHPKPSLDGHIN